MSEERRPPAADATPPDRPTDRRGMCCSHSLQVHRVPFLVHSVSPFSPFSEPFLSPLRPSVWGPHSAQLLMLSGRNHHRQTRASFPFLLLLPLLPGLSRGGSPSPPSQRGARAPCEPPFRPSLLPQPLLAPPFSVRLRRRSVVDGRGGRGRRRPFPTFSPVGLVRPLLAAHACAGLDRADNHTG